MGRRSTSISVLVTVGLIVGTIIVARDGGGSRTSPDVAPGIAIAREAIPDAPVAVTFRVGAGSARLGESVRVRIQVLAAHEIRSVRLWDGDTLQLDQPVEPPARTVSTTIDWAPTRVGTRMLLARAIDSAGDEGQSAPQLIRVHENTPPVARPIDDGTLEARPVAARLPAGGDPLAPSVSLDASGCSVRLSRSGGSGSHRTLLVAVPGSGSFAAAFADGSAGDTIPVAAGPHLFVNRGARGALSDPVEVDVPAECTERRWDGTARLVDGRLVTTAVANADRAYLYVAVDDGPWQRVPAGDRSFVDRDPSGTFDFGGRLPALSGRSLQIRAWGRAGGELVSLGSGSVRLPAVQKGVHPTYAASQLDATLGGALRTELDWIATKASSTSSEINLAEQLVRWGTLTYDGDHLETVDQFKAGKSALDFRWTSHNPATTHAIWQVSTLPPPPSPDLAFPGLLAFQAMEGTSGEFPIDVDAVVKGKGPKQGTLIPKVSFGDVSPKGLGVSTDTAGVVIPTGNKKTAKKPPAKLPLHLLGLISDMVKPTALFVRVVPMAGTQPLPNVSNWVVFGIGDAPPPLLLPTQPGGPPAPEIASTDVTFVPPHSANYLFGRCVRVVANPQAPTNIAVFGGFPQVGKPAPVGATLCAEYDPPDKEWYEYLVDALEFAADVWNEVATFVNDLKADIVNFIADLGCSQALGATGVVDDPKGVCSSMITTAIDTYLAANGIPPTLPTSEVVKATLKGDLAKVAATQVAEYCPDLAASTCQEQAEKVAAYMLDKIEQEVSGSTKKAASSGDWKLILADYVKVVPEPAGLFGPAIFGVTVHLATPPTVDTYCTVEPRVTGHHPKWTYVNKDKQLVTKPMDGPVFAPVNGTVLIPAGASVASATVAMGQPDMSFMPSDMTIYNTTAYKKSPPYWAWFESEATITMSLTGCGLDSATAKKSVIPGGIPYPKSPSEVQVP